MKTNIWTRKFMLRPTAHCSSGCWRDLKKKDLMDQIFWLSVITASLAFTITETKLFLFFREWVTRWSTFFGKLVHCGYCTGHWIAFVVVAVFQPLLFETWWLLDYFLTSLAIAWLAAFQWIIMCLLMKFAGKWIEFALSYSKLIYYWWRIL